MRLKVGGLALQELTSCCIASLTERLNNNKEANDPQAGRHVEIVVRLHGAVEG